MSANATAIWPDRNFRLDRIPVSPKSLTVKDIDSVLGLGVSQMRLADWLRENGVKRFHFAALVRCSPQTITALCADPPGQWPGRDLALRIREATGGAVTADDFLPPSDPHPGPSVRPSPTRGEGGGAAEEAAIQEAAE